MELENYIANNLDIQQVFWTNLCYLDILSGEDCNFHINTLLVSHPKSFIIIKDILNK